MWQPEPTKSRVQICQLPDHPRVPIPNGHRIFPGCTAVFADELPIDELKGLPLRQNALIDHLMVLLDGERVDNRRLVGQLAKLKRRQIA